MKSDEIVYSNQKGDFLDGKRYANPRFFAGVKSDVRKVTIVGDWPRVAEAYKAAGIEVVQMDAPEGPKRPPLAPPPVSRPDPESVEIPADWRDLHWQSIRKLASSFTTEPVLNKEQAVEVVEAELARREGGED